jgi:hypothetical protein
MHHQRKRGGEEEREKKKRMVGPYVSFHVTVKFAFHVSLWV